MTGLTGGVGTIGKEEESVRKINDIFEKNKEAKKYIIDMKCINFRNIYEMPLAISDFERIIKEKSEIKKKNNEIEQSGKKHIENLLAHAESLLKAVIILHDSGYVHNDIKPGNLLKIKKDVQEFENEISTNLKKHKNKLVLSDFGTINNISDEIKRANDGWSWTENVEEALELGCLGAFAFDVLREEYAFWTSADRIKKRDVICCGYSLFNILCANETFSGNKPWVVLKNIRTLSTDMIFKTFKLEHIYVSEDTEKISSFVNAIKKMVAEDIDERYSASEALTEIQKIRDS